ncbi:MAG: glycosyltransferase family 2 protein [Bacteroidales bacterium]|nr:glycosyltransferase family 2 protein [Bacteroidales bacterium]
MSCGSENKHLPLVSIVMPAYNAAEFLEETVRSIQAQTFTDWELVIVDDNSTDATASIAKALSAADSRIRTLTYNKDATHPDGNSRRLPGTGAFCPRILAAEAARAAVIAPVDADDPMRPDYLERLYATYVQTGTQAVFPTLERYNRSGEQFAQTPSAEFMAGEGTKVHRGRDLVQYTLAGWRISCAAGIIDRQLYRQACHRVEGDLERVTAFSDEYLSRILLTMTERVTFSGAVYRYRIHDASVTHRNPRVQLDAMRSTAALVRFISEEYGADSREYALAQRQNMENIYDALRLLHLDRSLADDAEAETTLAANLQLVDWQVLRRAVSAPYYYCLRTSRRCAVALLRLRRLLRGR